MSNTAWFAVFPEKWQKCVTSAQRDGRDGPNLIVYRTNSSNPRDHYVIPFFIARDLLVEGTITHSEVNGIYRWNLTLRDGKIHVTHRSGHLDISKYHSARLVTEKADAPITVIEACEHLINDSPVELILEGITREITIVTRSRSQKLRNTAIERSRGKCEACGINFSLLFDGKGIRVLQVHHKNQLSLQDKPELTSPDDLAVVCANCHLILHSDHNSTMPVDVLRKQWAKHNENTVQKES